MHSESYHRLAALLRTLENAPRRSALEALTVADAAVERGAEYPERLLDALAEALDEPAADAAREAAAAEAEAERHRSIRNGVERRLRSLRRGVSGDKLDLLDEIGDAVLDEIGEP